MADGNDDAGLLAKLGSNGLIWVLLAAFGAAVLQHVPLLVQHPPVHAEIRALATGDVVRDARLWQDPFDLAPAPDAPTELRVGDLPPRAALQLGHTVQEHPGERLVLVVPLQPGGYAESVERRRRTRVAVAEGLMAEGRVAENPQQLHLAGSIPYEWFVPTSVAHEEAAAPDASAARSSVLVLWIAESGLGQRPREALCHALAELAAADAAPGDGAGKTRVAVLGPGDSQGLLWTLADRTTRCAEGMRAAGSEGAEGTAPLLHFFTSTATIALPPAPVTAAAAGLRAPGRSEPPDANAGLADSAITRTVANDEQLARTLVDELSLRSVNPFRQDEVAWTLRELWNGQRDDSDDAVALVTEAETAYGRAMPGAFCRGFRGSGSQRPAPDLHCEDDPAARRGLHLFSYLRGLNGELQHAGRGGARPVPRAEHGGPAWSGASADGGSGKGDGASGDALVERAEGNAQTDYLERLADRLTDLDRSLQQDPVNPRALRAIGLLGTDVYDKLMLLRALKPRFPGVVFFTTDLDARLLDGVELPFTRNLVIASSFGLTLAGSEAEAASASSHPLDQHGFPDFRDGYQTAAFLTTRVAVRVPDGQLSSAEQACLRHWTSHVHVYEIGRDSLLELRPRFGHQGEAGEQSCLGAGWSDPQPEVGAASQPLTRRQRAGLAMIFLALTFTFLQWAHGPSRRAMEAMAARHPQLGEMAPRLWGLFGGALLLSLLAAALLALLWPWVARQLTSDGLGQPFLLLSGLSVWPALLLVAVATAYWLSVLVRISGRLSHNLAGIHAWLGLALPFDTLMARLRASAGQEALLQRCARHMFPPSLLPSPAIDGVPPFWSGYLRGGLASARRFRWLVLGGMMIAVFCILNDPLGNHLPLRGQWVEFTYTVLNNLALIVLMLLMVAVADASLFCTDFLDHLGGADGQWPAETLERARTARGMSPAVALPWLRVELAARRSRAITPLIYHPFGFMALLIVSHSTLFSPWRISLQQLVVVAATAIAMLFCSLRLRASAEAVRGAALDALEEELQRLQALGAAHAGECEQLRGVMRSLSADRRGALAPFAQQPLIRSLVLPLLSLAGTSAAELASLWQ